MAWQEGINQEPHVVYRIYGTDDNLLYVGVTVNFRTRLQWHKNRGTWPDSEYGRHELTWYDNRPEAESAELAAILTENPRYNMAGGLAADRVPPRPGRPTRVTLDLDPERWVTLKNLVITTGAGSAAKFFRAALDEMEADPELAAQVLQRARAPRP